MFSLFLLNARIKFTCPLTRFQIPYTTMSTRALQCVAFKMREIHRILFGTHPCVCTIGKYLKYVPTSLRRATFTIVFHDYQSSFSFSIAREYRNSPRSVGKEKSLGKRRQGRSDKFPRLTLSEGNIYRALRSFFNFRFTASFYRFNADATDLGLV